jgi:MYXO-CTERM domain-containing protein
MTRRIAWAAALMAATLLSWFVADRVPSEEGGLLPAGLLLLVLGGILLRRQTLPRTDRTV